MSLSILDGRRNFWQWDSGQRLLVGDTTCGEVHYCNGTGDCALVAKIETLEGGLRVAAVPNILLQSADTIIAYLYQVDEHGASTRQDYRFRVLPRNRPDDYVYTESEVFNYTYIDQRMTELEGKEIVQAPRAPRVLRAKPAPQVLRASRAKPAPPALRVLRAKLGRQVPRVKPAPRASRERREKPAPQVPRVKKAKPDPRAPRALRAKPAPQAPRASRAKPAPPAPRVLRAKPARQVPRVTPARMAAHPKKA